jgi:translocation and assembly module TamA
MLVCSPGAGAEAGVAVAVEGVEGAPADNVRALLSIVQYPEANQDALQERRVRRLHRRAPEEIRRALKPFGYYEPSIETRLRSTDDGWQAIYRIDPGPRIPIAEVTIEFRQGAADDPAFADLRGELPLQSGEPLLHADYEQAKRRIMELAAERGYLEARWAANVLRVDPSAREARARLILDSGPRYAFGEVTFEQDFLAGDFLRRYLRFQPGDPYLAGDVRKLQYALDDSGYFRRVNVQPQRGEAVDGRLPVRVDLERRPQNRYTFGIGYGTNTGPRVSAGWENRYVNRQGHSFNADIEVAAVSTTLSARYTIPLDEPGRERAEFFSSLGDKEIGGGETTQFELGARRVEQSGPYQGNVSLTAQRNRDTIGDDTKTTDVFMPGAGVVYSSFNDPAYATSGLSANARVRGASERLGSEVTFVRGRVGAKGVVGLWPDARLLLRGAFGAVDGADVEDLPLSQRFFAGGDNSVRGFDYQALGPTNEQGQVVGGRFLTVASVEFEQLIVGNWGAAVFVDSGNAMNDYGTGLRTAAGVGLRYRSPVGVFRVDVAEAVDGDESPRLHLSLGVNL